MKYNIIKLFRDTFQAIEEHKAIYYDYETYTDTLVEDIAARVANLTNFNNEFKKGYLGIAKNLRLLEQQMSKEAKIKGYTILVQKVRWFFRDFIYDVLVKSAEKDKENKCVYACLVFKENKVTYKLCSITEDESSIEKHSKIEKHCKRLADELTLRWYQHVDDLQFFYTSTVFLESLKYETKHSLAVNLGDNIIPLVVD